MLSAYGDIKHNEADSACARALREYPESATEGIRIVQPYKDGRPGRAKWVSSAPAGSRMLRERPERSIKQGGRTQASPVKSP